ncbi:uncharacterized protein K02A2.6-like [Uranotaenia lowii]|uniref:uncharacterized protein K02A2.6-like n=1 Tax=Uranotaenia lowii TaxID=190385 RepID=UPI00247A5D1B|nr:uncharacterized protein K02A2.6-like [Uranotaenia lowii]
MSNPENSGFHGYAEASTQDVLRQMAEQNTRLLLLLERLTTSNATPTANQCRSPDQIIESLSSVIREFHYDPEAGITFERWFNKYEDLFRADGKDLDDAAKIRLLMRSLSVPVHEKFTNYLLPRHPRDFSFGQVIEKLKTIFSEKRSLFSKRYDCLHLIKNDSDDFVTYAGNVNRFCEDFDLANLTIDQFKALIFVCGMQSSQEAEVRTRLLAKLESDTSREINLEALVTECHRISSLKHDIELVEKQASPSVHAVQKAKITQRHSKSSFQAESAVPRSPCWQCGAMHFVKDCSYKNHTCQQCNRQGHKEGYCNCFRTTADPSGSTRRKDKQPTQSRFIHSVNHIGNRRKYVKVTVNHTILKLQIDSGSDITVISEQSWRKCGSPTLQPTHHHAGTASGDPLPLIGEFGCALAIDGEEKFGTCYVTSVKNLNLLGLDYMDAFDLWDKPLSNVCNQVNCSNSIPSTNRYLTRFPEVFRDGLGLCVKTKRPVPFNAVQRVDEELDRLQQLNIITPVDYADWAAPIVSVRKPGGKIRVCADYSTGLNAMLEPHHYPLPTPDDILAKLSGNKFSSIIYLSDAYLQVEVDEESKKLLTINTHRGLFQFNRLAPGVKSAPGAFQQLMSKMIAGLEGVDNFLDDFIVYSKTLIDHIKRLDLLFSRIQEYGFRLRPEKCSFHKPEIKYLGFIVNANGIKPDPEKVAAIANMPEPTDLTTRIEQNHGITFIIQ